jgi:dTDP-4-amino-4,6-dideoxygalactose transaminase
MRGVVVPYLDLKAQYAALKPEIDEAVARVLASGVFILGPEVAAFENDFAAYCGTDHAIAVNSGTSALHAALLAADIGPGDEVITTPFTFVATAAAICSAGARPVFVDIEPRSFTLDPGLLDGALSDRTRAILPVHLYGQPCDMDPILAFARRHSLAVIEDAAQAHGARYKGRPAGSLGDFGCFSFYPGKNLGACGEGGIVVTNDANGARLTRMIRDWGQERKYEHVLPGFNYRMDALQGAILRVKLRHLDAWTDARRDHAHRYAADLAEAGFQAPEEMSYARHVYHVYAIRTPERSLLQRALEEQGIQTGIHYPTPVHLQPAYAHLGYEAGAFPVAEAAAREVLSLPLHPDLTTAQQQRVVDALATVSVRAVARHKGVS